MRTLSIALLAVLALTATAWARSPCTADSRVVPSQAQASIDSDLDERLARDWGLRPEEWTRYRQLMQGPLSIYSPKLDPLTALGIEVRSAPWPSRMPSRSCCAQRWSYTPWRSARAPRRCAWWHRGRSR